MREESAELVAKVAELRTAVARQVSGQGAVLDEVLCALFAGGHVLLEGVPGLGKTLIARTLAAALGTEFRRIQFTPDLMPADVVGTNIFDLAQGRFHLVKGPVFTQVLLADEVNRTPPKTQAALLEAMEERQVTLDGQTLPLPDPFFVVATQNPLDHEGTYPLPEAQLDRFMLKIVVGYPSPDEERAIYRRQLAGVPAPGGPPPIDAEALAALRASVARVHVEDKLVDYTLGLVAETRRHPRVAVGASPRAGLMWLQAARARAALDGRAFVLPDDVKRLAAPLLRHRLRLTADAELEGQSVDSLVAAVLDRVSVPR